MAGLVLELDCSDDVKVPIAVEVGEAQREAPEPGGVPLDPLPGAVAGIEGHGELHLAFASRGTGGLAGRPEDQVGVSIPIQVAGRCSARVLQDREGRTALEPPRTGVAEDAQLAAAPDDEVRERVSVESRAQEEHRELVHIDSGRTALVGDALAVGVEARGEAAAAGEDGDRASIGPQNIRRAIAGYVCNQQRGLSNAAANGNWSEGSLNAADRAAVNKTGTTQLRVYFALDDNDDKGNDSLGYYSGDNSTSANRPQLVVTY